MILFTQPKPTRTKKWGMWGLYTLPPPSFSGILPPFHKFYPFVILADVFTKDILCRGGGFLGSV